MSKPNEYTDNFKSNLTCIFLLSVRAKLKKTICPRTLCTYILISSFMEITLFFLLHKILFYHLEMFGNDKVDKEFQWDFLLDFQ